MSNYQEENAIVTNSALFWKEDNDFVVCKLTTSNYGNLNDSKEYFDTIEKIHEGNKVKMIILNLSLEPTSSEVRRYAAQRAKETLQKVAIIVPNKMIKAITFLAFSFQVQKVPIKAFVSIDDAKNWLSDK